MNTFQEQRQFFDQHWPAMKQAAESGGADAVINFADAFDDPSERRVLYAFARKGLVHEEWQGRSLDAYVAVARAGIRECLTQARDEADPETSKKRINTANVISYNLSADLADCWDDPHVRERAHFEAGLHAAEDCIRWREELGNPPHTKSIAWWAKGIHQLSLGQTETAQESFTTSMQFALNANDGDDRCFGVVLGRGFAAIAGVVAGDPDGETEYEETTSIFRAQLANQEMKDDAQFGISQLERVYLRYT